MADQVSDEEYDQRGQAGTENVGQRNDNCADAKGDQTGESGRPRRAEFIRI
ncbi:MAG: hypothetical protein WCF33_23375 [Pseudonocardiaceae bacterium]